MGGLHPKNGCGFKKKIFLIGVELIIFMIDGERI
jgi:hypothetical protein